MEKKRSTMSKEQNKTSITDEQIKDWLQHDEIFNALTEEETRALRIMIPELQTTAIYTRRLDNAWDGAMRGKKEEIDTLERMVNKFITGLIPEGKEDLLSPELLFRAQVLRQGAMIDSLAVSMKLREIISDVTNRLPEAKLNSFND